MGRLRVTALGRAQERRLANTPKVLLVDGVDGAVHGVLQLLLFLVHGAIYTTTYLRIPTSQQYSTTSKQSSNNQFHFQFNFKARSSMSRECTTPIHQSSTSPLTRAH